MAERTFSLAHTRLDRKMAIKKEDIRQLKRDLQVGDKITYTVMAQVDGRATKVKKTVTVVQKLPNICIVKDSGTKIESLKYAEIEMARRFGRVV